MLFSVLIANYNNAQYLMTAINSVLRQTYTKWEIIVVDDASTDAFEACMRGYANDIRIKIFHNAINQGCGFTKARCAKEAAGSILGFLDPDDALAPNALALMIDAHQQRPECSLVSSTHYICDERLQVKRVADYPKALPPNTPYLLLGDGRIHHFVSFKKSVTIKHQACPRYTKKQLTRTFIINWKKQVKYITSTNLCTITVCMQVAFQTSTNDMTLPYGIMRL